MHVQHDRPQTENIIQFLMNLHPKINDNVYNLENNF